MFAKARDGGDGIGKTKAGKGVRIMVLVAIDTCSASPHENRLVQRLFDFMLTRENPERIIGDKTCDSNKLDEGLAQEAIESIAPHRCNRKLKDYTQDGGPLRRYKWCWRVRRTIGWIQHFRRLCIRWTKSSALFQGFLHLESTMLLFKGGFGIASYGCPSYGGHPHDLYV